MIVPGGVLSGAIVVAGVGGTAVEAGEQVVALLAVAAGVRFRTASAVLYPEETIIAGELHLLADDRRDEARVHSLHATIGAVLLTGLVTEGGNANHLTVGQDGATGITAAGAGPVSLISDDQQ